MNTGDPTWQAEIYVPQGGSQTMNHSGRLRTMCIRGPTRASQAQAVKDAQVLNAAVPEGAQKVRQIANQMQRTKKS